jgi:mannose-1-phosphate guanylyltransferase
MKAFVMAAGFGTRLRPFTEQLPKPLAPVRNVPALFYAFALLKEAGVREIVCNVHHHAAAIRKAVESADLSGLQITFSEEEPILGTGGGLKKCESLLDGDDFFLVNSDIVTDIDFTALARQHRSSGLPGTLALYETPHAAEIGAVGVHNGLVKDFRNMRNTGLESQFIYTGTAMLGPAVFEHLEKGFSSIVDTGFTGLIDNGGLGAYLHTGFWMDIGTLESYHKANTACGILPERLAGTVRDALGMEPCRLSPEATVDEGARVIRSVIGSGCRIGKGAMVEDSLLLPGSVVNPDETLRCSIRDRHHTVELPQYNK